MAVIIIKHVYLEESDAQKIKDFKKVIKGNIKRDEEAEISKLCGTNEQTFDRVNRNYN